MRPHDLEHRLATAYDAATVLAHHMPHVESLTELGWVMRGLHLQAVRAVVDALLAEHAAEALEARCTRCDTPFPPGTDVSVYRQYICTECY